LLAHLELKEKLLAYEGEFTSPDAVRRSVLIKQANSLPESVGVEAVITQDKHWVSYLPAGPDGRPIESADDLLSNRKTGHWKVRYLLSFKEVGVASPGRSLP